VLELTANGKFKGRSIIAAIPASEVFVDHLRMPKAEGDKWQETVLSRIRYKLPCEPSETMIRYIPTEENNVLVIATERKKIDRHLAIYEKANLQIKSLSVWPAALMNTYACFFGRRKADVKAVVMLLDIQTHCTNLVICRYKNMLFVRSIPIGTKQLGAEEMVNRLVLELTASKRQFQSMYREAHIERVIFLSGAATDREVCINIAKQLELPAQIGDCLAAVEIADPLDAGIERRGCQLSWAAAFGLSLAQ